jgi:molecular chaperone HscB
MQWAVRVNEAYRRLKDPLARGGYLCELAGVEVGAESNTAMPASFLMQQMEWREALDEAVGPRPSRRWTVRWRPKNNACWPGWSACSTRPTMPPRRQQVRALMFVNRFRADIDRRLEALDS